MNARFLLCVGLGLAGAWAAVAAKPKPGEEYPCVTWETFNASKVGAKCVGKLAVRASKDIADSLWSVGCETLDRDYADWDQYKKYVGELGVKRGRLFSGWQKTEKEKGVYDFAWLDRQVREMAAMGVKPWICLSYGNSLWGGQGLLGARVRHVTSSPEAFAAWLRYCRACVERYKDVVTEWEVWNEPFRQGEEYAEMLFETAKVIHEVQPEGRVLVAACKTPDYPVILEKLKREQALDAVYGFLVHTYFPTPEKSYEGVTRKVEKQAWKYRPSYRIIQGEAGCPAVLGYRLAMARIEWSEYSQAKWDLRLMAMNGVRNIPCNVFTMIDLRYPDNMNCKGLLAANLNRKFLYRRPSYYAVQNMCSFFDASVKGEGFVPCTFTIEKKANPLVEGEREVSVAKFSKDGKPVLLTWYSDRRPDDFRLWDRVTLNVPGVAFKDPVWVEMVTGRVYELGAKNHTVADGATTFTNLPMWDAPGLIAEREQVSLREGQAL